MLAPAPEVHPERVQSSCFDDMDAMSSAISGNFEYIPIRPGKFWGRMSQIKLEGFDVRRLVHAPILIHGEIPLNHMALNLQVRAATGLTLNGDTFKATTLAVLPEGAPIQVICPAEQDRIGFSFHAEGFADLLEVCGALAFPRGRHRMLLLQEDYANRLVRTFTAMLDLADSLPNLYALPGLSAALTEECHCLIASALSAINDRLKRPRQTKDMTQQVRAANDFMHAHINRPIYTEEVCAALNVSARTLHQSFASVYGMSPHAYLKRRRLVLVRRALKSAGEDHTSVKSVVLAHGFWHLSRFAHDYAVMFGEMPSETLGRSRGQTEPVTGGS